MAEHHLQIPQHVIQWVQALPVENSDFSEGGTYQAIAIVGCALPIKHQCLLQKLKQVHTHLVKLCSKIKDSLCTHLETFEILQNKPDPIIESCSYAPSINVHWRSST
jgi:hypothetical protein